MLVVTTENVPHYRVTEVKGQCFGVVVRSRGLGGNIMAGLRSLAGGEITEYTQLLEEARRHAVDRMVANATAMDANAIVMMRLAGRRHTRPHTATRPQWCGSTAAMVLMRRWTAEQSLASIKRSRM